MGSRGRLHQVRQNNRANNSNPVFFVYYLLIKKKVIYLQHKTKKQ